MYTISSIYCVTPSAKAFVTSSSGRIVIPGRISLVLAFAGRSRTYVLVGRTDLSSPKPGHATNGSGLGARRGGGARSGRTGCQQNCSPRRQAFLRPQTKITFILPGVLHAI